MTLCVSTSSPTQINKESHSPMTNSSSPLITPCSDTLIWSALHSRVEALLESRKLELPTSVSATVCQTDGESSRVKRMKEDSMLLIQGFDSIASSLSQLTGNLGNALQGTRNLAKSSTLTEITHITCSDRKKLEDEQGDEEEKKGMKRKLDDCCSEDQRENEKEKQHQVEKNLKKVKNLAVSMAKKSGSLARELKSVKSDMGFLQDRCALLEEENKRLRGGFGESTRPDEDDLVRLQLEALLAEKSRLATDNANLTRENQCLRQLVEYHQFATEDLSASYEEVIEGLCLDFSSPDSEDGTADVLEDEITPGSGDFDFHTPLRKNFPDEEDIVNH